MRKYLLLFLLVLSSCSSSYYNSAGYGYGGSAETEVGEVEGYIDAPEVVFAVQKVIAYLRHVKHLRLEDAGVVYNPSLNLISLEFTSQDLMEVRHARYLIVDLVQALLAEFNTNPRLASTFVSYPLTPLQVEVYIDFQSFNIIYNDPYYVGYLTLLDNEVIYYAGDYKKQPKNVADDVWNLRVESFDTALSVAIFERESEKMFKEYVELANPNWLKKEQYHSPDKYIPRFYSPYDPENPLFENPLFE